MQIHELPAVGAPSSNDDVFVLDTGSRTYKINYQALAEAILNTYSGLYMYNANQSVQAAFAAVLTSINNRLRLDRVANNLTTTSEGYGLDARQGRALKALIDNCLTSSNIANNLTTTSSGYALDARQGRSLKNQVDALNTSTTPSTGITGVTGAVCGKIAMISLTSLATITAGTASGSVIGQFNEDYYPAAVVDFRTSMATNIRLRINTSGQLLLGEDATANITPRGSVTYITAS